MNSYHLSFLLSTLIHLGGPCSSVLAFRKLWSHTDYSCLCESSVSTQLCLMKSICRWGMFNAWRFAILFLHKVSANENFVKYWMNIDVKANHKGRKYSTNSTGAKIEPWGTPQWRKLTRRIQATAYQNVLMNTKYSHIDSFRFWVNKWLCLFG